MEDSFITTPSISFFDRSKRGHKREEREKGESRLKKKRKKKKERRNSAVLLLLLLLLLLF